MSRQISIACLLVITASVVQARSAGQVHEFTEPEVEIDVVGATDGAQPTPRKALIDTIWIAQWDLDVGAVCDDSGWQHVDNHIVATGEIFWSVRDDFDATGTIEGNAALLGYDDNICCAEPDGYDNDWYQAIRIEYTGPATLSFDYLLDSEQAFDFLFVETDSACSSLDRVDFDLGIFHAQLLRTIEVFVDGFVTQGHIAQPLTSYGPGTHCVYVAFFSDPGFSPCDGLQPTVLGKALVVDNIVITDDSGTRSEDFTDGVLDVGQFVDLQDSAPFGEWARTFEHITDNSHCTENTTCAWLWTDDTTPTIANDPSMAFGPGGYVVKSWLDDIVISPWVSLASTPNAHGSIIQFRRFPGNFFSTSRIVQSWSVRAKTAESDGMGGSVDCVSAWGHAFQWNSLSAFNWMTPTGAGNPTASGFDMTRDFDPNASEIQIRHRTSDWQWIVNFTTPPSPFIPGPGPYVDRTRIGRVILQGPVMDEGIDARQQAQDTFPSEINPVVTPNAGEKFRPTTDRFGTGDFARGSDLGINNTTPNLIAGDSVSMGVFDVRDAGGVTAVEWYGAIIAGPHQGKAPAPHSVGANGFFMVAAQPSRASNGTLIEDRYFVDLDDFYLRGGDVLHYFWLASDALGGASSVPVGLSSVPASLEAAQAATGGLFEMSVLPTIDWDSGYLARISADPHGALDPTSEELMNSSQSNCILYVNRVNSRRRSGDVNRTSFMYTLDRLGYRGHYDVYDHQGMGNTNNQLGGRATVQQAQGYSLIVYDAGTVGPGGTIMPNGTELDAGKVDQSGWFRDWLAQASVSEAGTATLWLIGSNVIHEIPSDPLYTIDMGVVLNATGQGLSDTPTVVGETPFTFARAGGATCGIDFSGEEYVLVGSCVSSFLGADYDGLGSSGTAVETHRYTLPSAGLTGDAAIVMNASPVGGWNTIVQTHPWFHIADPGSIPTSPQAEEQLLTDVLGCVLPVECLQSPSPTDARPGGQDDIGTTPVATALHPNTPNPFNPTTRIRFDLARRGHVTLRIYTVSGRLVRTLIDASLPAQRHTIVWDGLDDMGASTPSGVLVYRLVTAQYESSRKMVLVR